jgi:hypothetical protein
MIGTDDGQTFEGEWDYLQSKQSKLTPISSQPKPEDVKAMTHQPEQPNPAEPYLQSIKNVASGLWEQATALPRLAASGGLSQIALSDPEALKQAAIASFNTASTVAGGATTGAEKGSLGIFGGRIGSKTTQLADRLEGMGMKPEDIKDTLGVERGAEGSWLKEIGDEQSHIKPEQYTPDPGFIMKGVVGDYLEHPNLYAIYPEAKNIPLAITPNLPRNVYGQYWNENKSIYLNANNDKELMHSTLLHELQHYVQDIDGRLVHESELSPEFQDRFKGYIIRKYGMDTVNKILDLTSDPRRRLDAQLMAKDLLDYADYDLYRHMNPEVEARNTQTRRHFPPEERYKSLATETMDLDPRDIITKKYLP